MSRRIHRVLKVGLTGGIGSGKTTVARLFETLGVPVYYSDAKAKVLMHQPKLMAKIKAIFGEDAYDSEGRLNNRYISGIVFNDPQKLEQLNSAVHPAVEQDFLEWAEEQHADYVIEEAAILIEANAHLRMDKIIVVDADKEERIHRVMRRDGMTREAVEARIASQMDNAQRLSYADYVVKSGVKEMLLPQIVEIDQELRKIVLSS